MSGGDEYELLSHSEVERLRKQAEHRSNEGLTLSDIDSSLRDTTRSINDLQNLLGSVKRHILDDYAQNPNPEEMLDKVVDQNKKIAKSFVGLLKRVKAIEETQEEILSILEEGDIPSSSQSPISQPMESMSSGSPMQTPHKEVTEDSPTASESTDMTLDDLKPQDDAESKGFFKKLVGK